MKGDLVPLVPCHDADPKVRVLRGGNLSIRCRTRRCDKYAKARYGSSFSLVVALWNWAVLRDEERYDPRYGGLA